MFKFGPWAGQVFHTQTLFLFQLDFSIWIRLELPGPLGGLAVRVEFKCFVSAPFSIENGAETIENGAETIENYGETIENGAEAIENGAETIENGGTPESSEGSTWIIVRDIVEALGWWRKTQI